MPLREEVLVSETIDVLTNEIMVGDSPVVLCISENEITKESMITGKCNVDGSAVTITLTKCDVSDVNEFIDFETKTFEEIVAESLK